MKYEYALQAKRFCEIVLYVNSYCKEKDEMKLLKEDLHFLKW